MITINTILDMRPGAVPKIIHLSQYDSDFSLVFRLHASFGTLNIESGTTAEIRGTKGSGTGYSASATLNVSNSTVTVAGDAQMTAVAGQNIYEIVLTKNNKVLGSANFILLVERAALDADTITDASVLRELNAIVEGAETATQAAEDAEDAADRAEAAAESLEIDDTLTQAGQAADAKATGDAISDLTAAIAAIGSGISDIAKAALLVCFRHVAWTDEHGQTYYDALESALYAGQYPKISATFNPGTNIIYTDDALSTLKQYLTVKHYESASDSGTTVSANDYTLTGVLTEGTSTIIVTYNDLTTAFTINGVVDFYNTWEWNWTQSNERQLHIMPGNVVAGVGNNGIAINANTAMSANRRAFVAYKGKLPYSSYQTGEDLEYYPIPIPSTANKVTLSISPAERYVQLEIVKLVNGQYTYYNSQGAVQGGVIATFTASEDLFACVGTKYSQPDATYSENPTGYSVVFEEV